MGIMEVYKAAYESQRQRPCGSTHRTESGRGRKGVENDEERDPGQRYMRVQCFRAARIDIHLTSRTESVYI